jgi:hypothetical protein
MANENRQQVRNVGSGFTVFRYMGKSIAYLTSFRDSGQAPVGGSEFIQPLGSRHPTDIVTSRAIDGGTITAAIVELWHQEVWQQLQNLTNANDIIDVWEALAQQPQYVTCSKIITPPYGKKYGQTYHNCVVTGIPDGDDVAIGNLSVTKNVTISYTHKSRL